MLSQPTGIITLHNKKQIESLSVAVNAAYEMLEKGIECGIDENDDGLSISVKCVTDTMYRVEVSGRIDTKNKED